MIHLCGNVLEQAGLNGNQDPGVPLRIELLPGLGRARSGVRGGVIDLQIQPASRR